MRHLTFISLLAIVVAPVSAISETAVRSAETTRSTLIQHDTSAATLGTPSLSVAQSPTEQPLFTTDETRRIGIVADEFAEELFSDPSNSIFLATARVATPALNPACNPRDKFDELSREDKCLMTGGHFGTGNRAATCLCGTAPNEVEYNQLEKACRGNAAVVSGADRVKVIDDFYKSMRDLAKTDMGWLSRYFQIYWLPCIPKYEGRDKEFVCQATTRDFCRFLAQEFGITDCGGMSFKWGDGKGDGHRFAFFKWKAVADGKMCTWLLVEPQALSGVDKDLPKDPIRTNQILWGLSLPCNLTPAQAGNQFGHPDSRSQWLPHIAGISIDLGPGVPPYVPFGWLNNNWSSQFGPAEF